MGQLANKSTVAASAKPLILLAEIGFWGTGNGEWGTGRRREKIFLSHGFLLRCRGVSVACEG